MTISHTVADPLRRIVAQRVKVEGLRPFCREHRLEIGSVRSLLDGRDIRVGTATRIAEAVGKQLYLGNSPRNW